MLSPLPRHSDWEYDSALPPSHISLPRNGDRVGLCNVLFEDCSVFTRVTACTLAGSPKVTRYIKGFRVSERVAPLAPHRPHRAELPQRVPQGDSLSCPGMVDARSHKWVASEKLQVGLPWEVLSPRSALKPFPPSATNRPEEPP